jgi:hypothetical protein
MKTVLTNCLPGANQELKYSDRIDIILLIKVIGLRHLFIVSGIHGCKLLNES